MAGALSGVDGVTDFLLELRSEEIPARMQDKAREDLARLFAAEIGKAGLVAESVTTYATPRRLALIARGLPLETAAVAEEFKGPRTSAPAQALEGFLRKTGLAQEQLEDRDGVWFAVVEKAGRATADVLAEAVPAIVRAFPWPKSMRWGSASSTTESLRWVRPLQGIVAILGEALVPCAVDGIESGFATKGHRFHHKGEITIGGAHDYVETLRAAHVIVDQDERRGIIRDRAAALCAERGLAWIADEALVAENAGLTEWPVPLLGDFDPAFLEVPPEVVRLTLGVNQKYFVCADDGGAASSPSGEVAPQGSEGTVRRSVTSMEPAPSPNAAPAPPPPFGRSPSPKGEDALRLAPAFICTANIEASDGGAAIVAGNRKVLAARLSDARFFWDQDKKTPLAVHAEKLSRITFHEKLGTVADKVERVAKLARWLVEEGVVGASSLPFPSAGGRGASSPSGEVAARRADGGAGASFGDGAARIDGTERGTGPSDPFGATSPKGEDASLADLAQQAAELCKADLVTEMVGEFPELQGVMGGYYARAELDENGERRLPDAVADAIRDHYKPVGQGDAVPTAPVTVAVSLADKLDTLVGFFAIRGKPTGSKDPFALRRAALACLSVLESNALRIKLTKAIEFAWFLHAETLLVNHEPIMLMTPLSNFVGGDFSMRPPNDLRIDCGYKLIHLPSHIPNDFDFISIAWIPGGTADGQGQTDYGKFGEGFDIELMSPKYVRSDLLDFFADRLKVQQREAGVRHDLIDAVFALGGEDDLVRLLARVKALQAFVGTADGVNLLAGYKRAANILKKEGGKPLPLAGGAGGGPVDQADALSDSPTPNPSRKREGDYEPAEVALIAALDVAEPAAAAAVSGERFEEAMAALASLRAPIDAFFESVTVNDADPAKRAARLGLLARLTAAVNGIADFSKIEG